MTPIQAMKTKEEWADSAYTLAMMALQSERYQTEPDFRDATDVVLAWSSARRCVATERQDRAEKRLLKPIGQV